MSTPSGRQVVERYVAALRASDGAAVRACFAEDAEWELTGEFPLSGTWSGRDEIFDSFLTAALGTFDPESIRFDVTVLIGDGDDVAMEWTTRARSPEGEPYENRCAAVFRIREGRISFVREYLASAAAGQRHFARLGTTAP